MALLRSGNSKGASLAAALSVVLATGTVLFPVLAFAQAQTSPKSDPRRQSGAKVTTDPDPAGDPKGEQDKERVADAYQPKGIELGSFLLLPKTEVDVVYNSNVFAEENDGKGDFLTTIRPEFRLRSRFAQHAVNLFGQMEAVRHARYKRDDVIDGRLVADGRYEASSDLQFTALAEGFSRHEERGSPDDVRGDRPTPTRGVISRLGSKLQEGRYTFNAEVGAERRVFENVNTSAGTVINNHDRDRNEFQGSVRGGYEIFPGYAAVVALSANKRMYDTDRDDLGFQRDSHGYRAEAGVGLDISQLVRGDFLVGYLYQNYRDPRLTDPKGLAVRATFNWTPTKLTIVVPSLERSVQETTIAGASGMVRTSGSLLVRHEYARNIVVTGFAGAFYDEFSGTGNTSMTYEGRGRITYALDREIYVSGEVVQKIKDSDIPNGSFRQSVFGLRLGLQL